MQLRAVLFDMDDTLVITRQVKWKQHQFVARTEFGLEVDEAKLQQHWGEPFAQMLGNLYDHTRDTATLVAAYRKYHDDFPKLEYPGAIRGVTALLDAGIQVGVVTSMLTEVAAADLQRIGFPVDRFLTVQGSDESEFHKPDPRVFAALLRRLNEQGINPAQVTYVGDALIDQQAAQSAGMKFVGVTTGLFNATDFGPKTSVFPTVAEATQALLP